MRIRHLVVAVLALTATSADAQAREIRGWSFGPLWPHVADAGKRTVYGLGVGAAFMGFGLGMDKLNRLQCGTGCFGGNPVQSGISFAFLGVLFGGTGPTLHSKCNRSGRAILGIVGGIAGTAAAGAMVDSRMFGARREEPATFRVMGSGLLGMSLGAGLVTAIC